MKTIKRKVLIIALALFLLLPISSAAIHLNLEYPEFLTFDLNINQDINEVIAWFYYFVITIAGIAVFAMLVWGGFTWLTSTGDPSKIADAKDRIYSAFLGLLLILASFLIMQTINPELTVLNLPELSPVATCSEACSLEGKDATCAMHAAECFNVHVGTCYPSLLDCAACCCCY